MNLVNKSSKLVLVGKKLIAIQKDSVQSIPEASYSTILTLASYLSYHMPDTPPPEVKPAPKNVKDETFPSPQLSYNYYMQPWCDYLTKLCASPSHKGHWLIDNEEQIFVGNVTDEYIQSIRKEGIIFDFEDISNIDEDLQKIKKYLSVPQVPGKKIGLINFAASQLRKDIYRPKIHIYGLLLGIWRAQNEEWKKFDILLEEYPTEQQLQTMDVFILSGSHFSVNDNDPRINKAIHMVMSATEKNQKLKVIGICFGHQAISKYFGAKVIKKPLNAGIDKIYFKDEVSKEEPFLEALEEDNEKPLYVSKYHGDNVVTIPEGFEILASSEKCKNEAMVSQDKRILSFQFHSEYTKQYTKSYEYRVKAYAPDDPLKNFAGELKEEYQTEEMEQQITESYEKIRQIMRDFMDLVNQ